MENNKFSGIIDWSLVVIELFVVIVLLTSSYTTVLLNQTFKIDFIKTDVPFNLFLLISQIFSGFCLIYFSKKFEKLYLLFFILFILISIFILIFVLIFHSTGLLIGDTLIFFGIFILYGIFINKKIFNFKNYLIIILTTLVIFILYCFNIHPGYNKILSIKVNQKELQICNNESNLITLDLSYRNFNGCDLSGCWLQCTDFTNSTFHSSTLTNVNFKFSRFDFTEFNNSHIENTVFEQDSSSSFNNFDSTSFFPKYFFNPNLKYCNLEKVKGLFLYNFINKVDSTNILDIRFPKIIIDSLSIDEIYCNNYYLVKNNKYYIPFFNEMCYKLGCCK